MHESFIGELSILNRGIRQDLDRQLRSYGLRESNFHYIVIVCRRPGVSQSFLIENMYRSQSIVTKNINSLIEDGWISKQKDKDDHRKTLLFPTDKARKNVPIILSLSEKVNHDIIAELSDDEKQEFGRLLFKITQTYLHFDKKNAFNRAHGWTEKNNHNSKGAH